MPAGRRDVQRLPAQKLGARRHEMKLYAVVFGVPDPRNVVLVRIQSGKGQFFETVHRLDLLRIARRVLGREGQDAVRVAPFPLCGVDQLPLPVQIATHQLRGHGAPLGAHQVASNTAAAALPAGELNQHRPASRDRGAAPQAPGRSRQAGK